MVKMSPFPQWSVHNIIPTQIRPWIQLWLRSFGDFRPCQLCDINSFKCQDLILTFYLSSKLNSWEFIWAIWNICKISLWIMISSLECALRKISPNVPCAEQNMLSKLQGLKESPVLLIAGKWFPIIEKPLELPAWNLSCLWRITTDQFQNLCLHS